MMSSSYGKVLEKIPENVAVIQTDDVFHYCIVVSSVTVYNTMTRVYIKHIIIINITVTITITIITI